MADGDDSISTGAADPNTAASDPNAAAGGTNASGGSSIDPSQVWIGFGVKGGGFAAVFGATSLNGYVWRLDQLTLNPASFNVTEFQVGLGLGGTYGFSVLLALNTNNIYNLNQSWSGWSPSITASADGVSATGCASIIMTAGDQAVAAIKSLGSLKASEIYGVASALAQGASGAQGLKPCWITWDVPVPGVGWVQGSVAMSNSQLFITI